MMGKLRVKVEYDYDRDIEVIVRVSDDVVDAINESIFQVLDSAMSKQVIDVKPNNQALYELLEAEAENYESDRRDETREWYQNFKAVPLDKIRKLFGVDDE